MQFLWEFYPSVEILETFNSTGMDIAFDKVEVVKNTFIIIIIPVIIGMIINKKAPSFSAKMTKPVKIASAVILALVIVGIVLKEKDQKQHNAIEALTARLRNLEIKAKKS